MNSTIEERHYSLGHSAFPLSVKKEDHALACALLSRLNVSYEEWSSKSGAMMFKTKEEALAAKKILGRLSLRSLRN